MEITTVAEQRATAVAKLKRAASLPRMKDGRRPPMHVEAVSEGERGKGDDDGTQDSDGKEEEGQTEEAPVEEEKAEQSEPEKPALSETPSTTSQSNATRTKRRSRSRTRSRGSRDLKTKALHKQSPHMSSASPANESSADEYANISAPGEDGPPPSPPLVSPVPSHFPASYLLRSMSPPMAFYPGTTPSTPLPTLDDLSKGMLGGLGLFRSNSAGAARALALQKLLGSNEPVDMTFFSPSSTPPLASRGLARNNTVAGGERLAARNIMMHALGNRLKEAEVEQTSAGEDSPTLTVSAKRRRRRSKRNSSRASTVVDDRDEREVQPDIESNPMPTPSLPPPSTVPDFGSYPVPAASSSRTLVDEAEHRSPSRLNGDMYEMPMGRRGPVVEDEDDAPARLPYTGLPATPVRNHVQASGSRLPHVSDAPSSASTDSAPPSAVPVPFFISQTQGIKDTFPESPFATPLKEKVYPDEDEEQVLYQETLNMSRFAAAASYGRQSEISWVADPVPERMPVNDDDDDDDDDDGDDDDEGEHDEGIDHEAEVEDEPPTESSERPSSPSITAGSPPSAYNKELVVDTSPVITPNVPPSPSSIFALSTPGPVAQPASAVSPTATYPMRLSRSPSAGEALDFDESRPIADSTPKRGAWEAIKSITRTGSSGGRRSRTNSLNARDRRNNTDSSVSRESGVSQTSTSVKPEKSDASPGVFAHQQAQTPLMQTPSASTSILSLSPHTAPPGGVSPVPPASSADLLKYADSKLFPFPGMKQLEEQRRAKGINPSASVPDVTSPTGLGIESIPSTSSSSTATRQLDSGRERKLSHQASDTRLVTKYNVHSPPALSSTFSGTSQSDYFNVQNASAVSNSGGSLRLPMNLEGVKKWLVAKTQWSSQSSAPTTPNIPPTSSALPDRRPGATKKPSLSDLLVNRREPELSAGWEDVGSDNSRTPTSAGNGHLVKSPKDEAILSEAHGASNGHAVSSPTLGGSQLRSELENIVESNGSPSGRFMAADFSPLFSPPEPPSSTTPDPQSSLDDFPTRSTSESFSSAVSSSQHSPDYVLAEPPQSSIIMERLDEVLARGSRSSLWPNAIDDPPRKLVLCSPILQVANANTVKDRFLFLFNDILIIAKPILHDQDTLLDPSKPDPFDRKFIVKSVIRLRELKISADRDESRFKSSTPAIQMKHPVIREFVSQFKEDPDDAIITFWERMDTREDPVALGQLMFRTLDLDRVQLGGYLSCRTSRLALKAYIDSFGLTGMRIDKALRAFLLSIAVPPKVPGQGSALEYLLDAFASRWYEANAGFVAYDKDLAVRLVRATAQLNDVMHGGVANEPGITGYPRRNITTRDFVEAFRRFDSRCLVSDDLLDKIYASIRRERLSQARVAAGTGQPPDITITIKKALPSRLTYRIQSEPIILRIPQPDPQLTIQLFGQDLVFDPPTLTFSRSAEASFRVTGTSLGPKSIIMWRSGPNALLYSGLPLNTSVMVERAFMRNTFQIAFTNHIGAKRKYMFSLDDPLMRHQWTVSLKRQIDIASSSPPAEVIGSSSERYKSNERLAFRVLQETLMGPEFTSQSSRQINAVNQALARLNSSHRHGKGFAAAASPKMNGIGSTRRDTITFHVRSKSRSKVYPSQGPGKMELDLSDNPDFSNDDEPYFRGSSTEPQRPEFRPWNGRDLEMYCRQNSSIPSALAYLQVESTERLNGSAS